MTCDDVQRAVGADELSAETSAHLTTCSTCSGFAGDHLAAKAARHLEPRLRTRLRRRVVLFRGLTVLLAVVGVSAFAVLRPTPVVSEPVIARPADAPRAESELVVVTPVDHDREWNALVSLSQHLEHDLHRDVATSDATYAAFGALPQWLAPSSTLTLEN